MFLQNFKLSCVHYLNGYVDKLATYLRIERWLIHENLDDSYNDLEIYATC